MSTKNNTQVGLAQLNMEDERKGFHTPVASAEDKIDLVVEDIVHAIEVHELTD